MLTRTIKLNLLSIIIVIYFWAFSDPQYQHSFRWCYGSMKTWNIKKTKESSYKGLSWPIYLGEVLVTQADTFFNPNLNLG